MHNEDRANHQSSTRIRTLCKVKVPALAAEKGKCTVSQFCGKQVLKESPQSYDAENHLLHALTLVPPPIFFALGVVSLQNLAATSR